MNVISSLLLNKAEELGYTAIIEDGKLDYIFPTRSANTATYTPELYKPRKGFGETAGWTIQTTAYGSMESGDINKVIDGYKRAQQMVAYLEHSGIELA